MSNSLENIYYFDICCSQYLTCLSFSPSLPLMHHKYAPTRTHMYLYMQHALCTCIFSLEIMYNTVHIIVRYPLLCILQEIAWIEGFAILVAVVIVVFITALNDWTKDKQFRGLQKKLESDSRFSVIRDGQLHELPLVELVVGDVAQFKYGNMFPVDGLLIQVRT